MKFFYIFIFLFVGSKIAEGLRTPENCGWRESNLPDWNWRSENSTALQLKQGTRYGPPDQFAFGRNVIVFGVEIPWNTDNFTMEIHYEKTSRRLNYSKTATVETYTWNKKTPLCRKGSEQRTNKSWSDCTLTFNGDKMLNRYYHFTEVKEADSEFTLRVKPREQTIIIVRTSRVNRWSEPTTEEVKFIFTTDDGTCTVDTTFKDCTPVEFPLKVRELESSRNFILSYGKFTCAEGYTLVSEDPSTPVTTFCLRDATWLNAHKFKCVKDEVDED